MTRNRIHILFLFVLFMPALALAQGSGKAVYDKACALCHGTGLAGAPRFGNAADWQARLAGGTARLYQSALKGTSKGMPAKGGNLSLSDAEVKSAVDFMLSRVSVKEAAKPAAAKSESKPEAKPENRPEPAATAAAPAASAPVAPMATVAAPATGADVNAFNRLLRPLGKRHAAPAEDGIHDPANDGTHALQPPLEAYAGLPRSNVGARIDWVAALTSKKIAPRWDRTDVKAEPVAMDLNIVREVKGSMPDVVYPHKQHTEWLDCSNCHPAIFVPQKGANQISMASILLGQKCGVCHGKVAFPVSECRLCHSKKKDLPAPSSAQAAGAK
jgi:c(7)-type cytochrome triheme protein